jgi:hypothetical protein
MYNVYDNPSQIIVILVEHELLVIFVIFYESNFLNSTVKIINTLRNYYNNKFLSTKSTLVSTIIET